MNVLTLKKQLLLMCSLIILVFSGCSSNKQDSASYDIPSWYLNTPNNSAVYLYGAGEANNLEESKNIALNNLASKLSVNVSSVINTYKNATTDESGNSVYNKDISQAKKEAFILYTIQNDFNYSSYITKYDENIDTISTLKDSVVIELSTNEPSRFFSNELLALLNENQYKVSSQNSNTQIKIQNNTRYSVAKGWQIAKVTTNISTVSNGKTISNTTINSVGRST